MWVGFEWSASWARSEVKEVCIIAEDGVLNLKEGRALTFIGANDLLKALSIFFSFNLLANNKNLESLCSVIE